MAPLSGSKPPTLCPALLGNRYCESFNSKVRDELLEGEFF